MAKQTELFTKSGKTRDFRNPKVVKFPTTSDVPTRSKRQPTPPKGPRVRANPDQLELDLRGKGKPPKSGQGSSQKRLPTAGGTSAGSLKARAQRTATAVTQRARNDTTILRALGDFMERNAARNARQIPADPQPKVRYVGPDGANPKPQGQLPPGQQGGSLATRGGALAKREGGGAATAPRGGALATSSGGSGSLSKTSSGGRSGGSAPRGPRPGGRVVVNEQPRLPANTRGGALAAREGGGSLRGAASGGGGGGRSLSSASAPKALPQGGPLPTVPAPTSKGSSTRGGAFATRKAGGKLFGRANLATLGAGALAAGIANSGTPYGNKVAAAFDEEEKTTTNAMKYVTDRLSTKGPNAQEAGTRGAVKRPVSRGLADIRGTNRQVPKPAATRKAPSAPQLPPRQTGGGGGGGRVSASSVGRPSVGRPSAGSPTVSSSTPSKGPGVREWKDFNPGRGTSRTNNPLMRDLIPGIAAREDAAIKANKSTDVTGAVNAQPTGANISNDALKIKFDPENYRRKKSIL